MFFQTHLFLLLNTEEDILVTKQLLVAIDFHSMEKQKNTMEVNSYQ